MTTTLTPTETWQAWQTKLSHARSALADFEANMGTLALDGDAGALANQLTELRNAVTIAEAAEETARRAAPDPRIAQKQEQLERSQAQLADAKAKFTQWNTKLIALEGPYGEAKNYAHDYGRQVSMHELAIIQHQIALNELQRAAAQ